MKGWARFITMLVLIGLVAYAFLPGGNGVVIKFLLSHRAGQDNRRMHDAI